MKNLSGRIVLTLLLFTVLSISTKAQTTTTNTNCNTAGSTSVNCTSTSTTTDTSAQQAQTQQQWNQAGQQMGAALGVLVARKRAIKAQEEHVEWNLTYCTQNPSGSVVNGYGQTQDCAKEYAVTQTTCSLHPKEKFCRLMPAFTASREQTTAQTSK